MAESVETPEQLGYLRVNGCDEIQGYYLSKPPPRCLASLSEGIFSAFCGGLEGHRTRTSGFNAAGLRHGGGLGIPSARVRLLSNLGGNCEVLASSLGTNGSESGTGGNSEGICGAKPCAVTQDGDIWRATVNPSGEVPYARLRLVELHSLRTPCGLKARRWIGRFGGRIEAMVPEACLAWF